MKTKCQCIAQTTEYILTLIMDTQLLIPYLTNVQQTRTLNYVWLITYPTKVIWINKYSYFSLARIANIFF